MSETTTEPQAVAPPATAPTLIPTPIPPTPPTRLARAVGVFTRVAGLLSRRMPPVDLAGLLDALPPIEYRPAADDDRLFEQASIAKVLLLMLRVNQESEYLLCLRVAVHSLGSVAEPGAPLG